MKNNTILLMLNGETDDQYIEAVAQASIDFNLHVSFFLMSSGVAVPPMIYGASLYGTIDVADNWQHLMNEALAAQAKRVEEIEGILARVGCSADVQAMLCSHAGVSDHVAWRARVSDLAVLAPNMRKTLKIFNEAAYGVLFKSPIGLMVNALPTIQPKRVLIPWDSSYAVSTAVHAAMPYLKTAEDVNIVCFDPETALHKAGADPGADVAAWLSHHGCRVSVSQDPSGGNEIAHCIQDRALELGVELVVLGAYGHSRLIQAVLGGTTRAMLEQTDLPILMAH